jgi:hypothetical protein
MTLTKEGPNDWPNTTLTKEGPNDWPKGGNATMTARRLHDRVSRLEAILARPKRVRSVREMADEELCVEISKLSEADLRMLSFTEERIAELKEELAAHKMRLAPDRGAGDGEAEVGERERAPAATR